MNTELKHYGVKGMKWGVHRFQKKDGTLTSAGKKRHFEKNDELYSKGKVLSNAKSGPYKENEYVKERKRQQKHIAMARRLSICLVTLSTRIPFSRDIRGIRQTERHS